jgi:hypothetical protein
MQWGLFVGTDNKKPRLMAGSNKLNYRKIVNPLEGESCSQCTNNRIVVIAVLTRRGQPDYPRGD